jgi:hypothetical protein
MVKGGRSWRVCDVWMNGVRMGWDGTGRIWQGSTRNSRVGRDRTEEGRV